MADTNNNLKQQIEDAILHFDAKASRTLIYQLDQLISGSELTAEQLDSLAKVRAQLAIIAIRFQSDSQLEDLFLHQPIQIASVFDQAELINKVNARLGHEPFIDDRNALRDRWKEALMRSQQRIGNDSIQLGAELAEPTIQNWIKLFIVHVGNEAISNVKRASFYAKNSSITKLSDSDKVLLRKILSLYEFLKLRSDQVESLSGQYLIEDASGKIQVLSKDDVTPLYDENTIREFKLQAEKGELPANELINLRIAVPEVFAKYPVPIKNQRTNSPIQDVMENYFIQLENTYGSIQPADTTVVTSEQVINQLLAPSIDIDMLQSYLMVLFQDQGRFAAFMRDNKIHDFLLKNIASAKNDEMKKNVEKSTLHPSSFQFFFELIFKEKALLTNEEALWKTYQVLQYLPLSLNEMRTIVTYDVKQQALMWRY